MVPTFMLGCTLVVGGLAAGLLIALSNDDIAWATTLQRLAFTAVVVGVTLLVYAGLRRKGRSIEEAYRLGYDVGFENGFQAHVAELVDTMDADDARPRFARRRIAAQRREHPGVAEINGGGER